RRLGGELKFTAKSKTPLQPAPLPLLQTAELLHTPPTHPLLTAVLPSLTRGSGASPGPRRRWSTERRSALSHSDRRWSNVIPEGTHPELVEEKAKKERERENQSEQLHSAEPCLLVPSAALIPSPARPPGADGDPAERRGVDAGGDPRHGELQPSAARRLSPGGRARALLSGAARSLSPPSVENRGFYPVNHTDCLQSYLHHCFDGITGELAHAFFPPTGEIHFDDDEYWILGNMRFSWKKGVWLTDLVHVAAHEIGHVLGLMHSQNPQAIMHLNATLTGRKLITQDDVWGVHRLYGCLDRLFICPAWARKGYCESKRKLMQKHCPHSCDFCYAFPFPTVAPTAAPPRTKHKLVAEGKKLTFRCGKKIAAKQGKVYWYKDGELLEYSHPGYISLKNDHISIVANAINEGTYTCIVRKKNKVLTNYSWKVRVRF
uniref:Matrix metallopeptidase 23B n=1 Tax=Astyanax mexicanus TaxID=7994 RepID=A0A8B9RMC3_ASTMX